jgi:biopolymer transport protein ExbB
MIRCTSSFRAFAFFAAVFFAAALTVAPSAAIGQEDAGAVPAADASVQDAAPATTLQPETNYLQWLVRSMGWHYTIAFLAISFVLVALVVMNIVALRRDSIAPAALVDDFQQRLEAKQFQEAYELAKADDSLLGQVLAAGISKVSGGYDEALEAMQEAGDAENMRLEHLLGYLALIGTVSPMIGLLGTVEGMVQSFRVIATTTSGAPNPQELADGISKALFTTLVGLYLAIPALTAYNLLRNRLSKLVLEAGIAGGRVMARFKGAGAKPAK